MCMVSLVMSFQRAVDELDSLLLRASRNDRDASAKLMKEKITVAMDALDR